MGAISLKLPEDVLEASRRCADTLHLSRAAYIRRAVERMNRQTQALVRARRSSVYFVYLVKCWIPSRPQQDRQEFRLTFSVSHLHNPSPFTSTSDYCQLAAKTVCTSCGR